MNRHVITTLGGRAVGWLETLQGDDLAGPIGGDKTVVGTPGDDKLHGGRGDDDIDGLAGADTMIGRLGNDTYHVDDPGDVVRERAGGGTDTVVTDISYQLGHDVENLTLRGLFRNEDLTATGNNLANVIIGNAGENVLDGRGGDDLIMSGGSVGPFEGDTLLGGNGNDTLIGGTGYITSDLLQGGAGADVLQVTSGANVLDGGDGNDLLTGGSGDGQHFPMFDTLIGGAGKDTLEGGGYQSGGDGADLMHFSLAHAAYGGAGNDTIEGTGGAGYDNLVVDAGSGDDSVNVYAVNNQLILRGGDGNDTLTGGAATAVSIDGGAGDDVLTGTGAFGSGPQHLVGGDGDDTLSVTRGVSTLEGDAGSDLFILRAKEVLGTTMTSMLDFTSGEDKLGVSQAVLPVGNGDQVVDGGVVVDGPGGFSSSAELVIVAADVVGGLSLEHAAAAIGSADQAYAAGQTAVFLVSDGASSWALYFQSSAADAQVSAAELTLIGRLDGTPSTTVDDVVWTG